MTLRVSVEELLLIRSYVFFMTRGITPFPAFQLFSRMYIALLATQRRIFLNILQILKRRSLFSTLGIFIDGIFYLIRDYALILIFFFTFLTFLEILQIF